MIYTGYFAQARKYQEARLILLSIANKCPEGIKAMKIPWLAPGTWIYSWKRKCNQIGESRRKLTDEYIHKYTEDKLSRLSPETVFERICGLVNHHDAILLCYEKLPEGYTKDIVGISDLEPGKTFCHRHIVSAFLRSGGFECGEYLIHEQQNEAGGPF
jgi:hypothetical protein